MQTRPDVPASLSDKVFNPQNPSPFTVILRAERGASDSQGKAMLFVGDEQADAFDYTLGNGLTSATALNNIRVGVGTASGGNYRA